MNRKINLRFSLIALFIFLAAISRFLPHPPNFTPVGGMALFGAAYFAKKYWAFIIPFLAIWLSNLVIDNVFMAQYYEGFQWFSQPYVFISFALIAVMGLFLLKKINLKNLLVSSVLASSLFFLVTNLGSWFMDPMNLYADDFSGLVACMTAGIPFFWNTLIGDMFYVLVLFGSFEWIQSKFPQVGLSTAN